MPVPFNYTNGLLCHIPSAVSGAAAGSDRLSAAGSSAAQPSGSGTSAGSAATEPEPELDTGQLPEGFFDDPQKDAKVRIGCRVGGQRACSW